MIETYLQPLPHGITLSCRAAGPRGRPVLFFLHGFPEGAFIWDEILEYFAKDKNGGYRCVAPNLRGFERSSAPPEVSAYRPKHLVQDIAALVFIETQGAEALECLVAHDWGGAVAWNFANQLPHLTRKLAIINSPHPGTFLRELKTNPVQQRASAYMNFLIREDAEQRLVEDDYRMLWSFLTDMFGAGHSTKWLTDAVKMQYREVWGCGMHGGCNYYRSSPLRPPRPEDPAAAAVDLPPSMLTISMPTQVIWGMDDKALPPDLIEGLAEFVPHLTIHKIPGATHWILHEEPALVTQLLQQFLQSKPD